MDGKQALLENAVLGQGFFFGRKEQDTLATTLGRNYYFGLTKRHF